MSIYEPSDEEKAKIDNDTHKLVVQFFAFKEWWSNDTEVASVMGSREALVKGVSNFTKLSNYTPTSLKSSLVTDASKAKESTLSTANTLFAEEESVAVADVTTASVSWIPFVGDVAAVANIGMHIGMDIAIRNEKEELNKEMNISDSAATWLTNYPEVDAAIQVSQYMVDFSKVNDTYESIAKTIMGYIQDCLANGAQKSQQDVSHDFDNMKQMDGTFWMAFHDDATQSLIQADSEDREDVLAALGDLRGTMFGMSIFRLVIKGGKAIWKSGKQFYSAYKARKTALAELKENENLIEMADLNEFSESVSSVESPSGTWNSTETVATENVSTTAKVAAIFQALVGVAEGVVAVVERVQVENIIDEIYGERVKYAEAVIKLWGDSSSSDK
ncbi:hypothetical protein FGB62_229g03 [Gracilaria domingensis]|nr:hypothetical protein FGB62_229g03 [Gracilaria domingensis]